MRALPPALAFWLPLSLACFGLHALGFGHALIFDDARLVDGSVFGRHGSLLTLQPRMLAYGSFVWIDALAPGAWAVQRAFNVALHLGVCASLHALFLALMPEALRGPGEPGRVSGPLGLRLGIVLFALAPVSVYAVDYLIQRSVLMASLGVALAALAFVHGLQTGRRRAYVLAALAYLAAVLSKEHAFVAILLVLPLAVLVRRPPAAQVLAWAALALGAAAVGALVLARVYPHLPGRVFDETSTLLTAQLEALQPGVASRMLPLSLLNQAALFFVYGVLWFLPWVGAMAIDLRPAFPLSLLAMPQLLGALAYLGLLAGSAWLLLRRPGVPAYLGLALLMPGLLFTTEFATVWVQDPLVLYRSYLWALPIPALFGLILAGWPRKLAVPVAGLMALAFAALLVERLQSLKDPATAWADAAEKVDLQAPPQAVGRYRPFLNRGAAELERLNAERALADFRQARALGEPTGAAWFNQGVAEQVLKRHAEALQSLAAAEQMGFHDAALHYHRAESLLALGRLAEAEASFNRVLVGGATVVMAEQSLLRRAEIALRQGRHADAVRDFGQLVREHPQTPRHALGLGMALVAQRDGAAALPLFQALGGRALPVRDAALAHYGRALALALLQRPEEARDALAQARRLDPQNPSYLKLQERWAREVTLPGP